MRAVVCEKLGDPRDPGVLSFTSLPSAPIKPGHVRIQVVAASLNFPDALQCKGEYQQKLSPPFVPGSEVSGIVTEVGSGVKHLSVGDKVCAVRQGAGAFAEECVAHVSGVWKVPSGVDVASAAAIPIVYGTADVALRHRAQLKEGQTLLVLGAAGGVGTAAVQIGKLLGARVVAVVTGADKARFIAAQGADEVIDAAAMAVRGGGSSNGGGSNGGSLSAAIKAAAPQGVNVVFDPVGGPMFGEAMKAVAWGAHVLVIGFASGGVPKLPANILLVKNTTVHGIFWGSYMQFHAKVLQESMEQVLKWVASGQLQVQVSHRFPLEQAAEAFKVVLSRKVKGKVLLDCQANISKL